MAAVDVDRIVSDVLASLGGRERARSNPGLPTAERAIEARLGAIATGATPAATRAHADAVGPAPAGWPAGIPFGYAPVGVSNRHTHFTKEHVGALFGAGYEMTPFRPLKQPGQWASKETVTVVGPKGVLQGLRMVGPCRDYSQVELAVTDCVALGLPLPPMRQSGDLQGTGSLVVVGPKGCVTIREGVILAGRHLHIHPEEAAPLGLKDRETLRVRVAGPRGGIMENVIARVGEGHRLELHLDTDEANAFGVKSGDLVEILR